MCQVEQATRYMLHAATHKACKANIQGCHGWAPDSKSGWQDGSKCHCMCVCMQAYRGRASSPDGPIQIYGIGLRHHSTCLLGLGIRMGHTLATTTGMRSLGGRVLQRMDSGTPCKHGCGSQGLEAKGPEGLHLGGEEETNKQQQLKVWRCHLRSWDAGT